MQRPTCRWASCKVREHDYEHAIERDRAGIEPNHDTLVLQWSTRQKDPAADIVGGPLCAPDRGGSGSTGDWRVCRHHNAHLE
jgi:hypothetical protein